MVKMLVVWTTLFISTALASHGNLRSCYECSKQAKNYMCNWKDDGLVACCEPGSTSLYCQPSESNKCSPTFEVSGSMFFTYCPRITPELCGKDTTLRKNMTLKASTTKETFKIDTLK